MRPKIIGLAGRKRSGKSSAAEVLEQLAGPMVMRTGFAYPIKRLVGQILPDHEHVNKEAVRPLYQAVGEVFKNLYGDRYWIDQVEDHWEDSEDHYELLLIEDVRFPMEQRWIASRGGIVVKVDRPHVATVSDNHPSETNVDSLEYDYLLTNNQGLKEFQEKVEALFRQL